MGSVLLSDPSKNHLLGSVSTAVTKASLAHCCVVKNYSLSHGFISKKPSGDNVIASLTPR